MLLCCFRGEPKKAKKDGLHSSSLSRPLRTPATPQSFANSSSNEEVLVASVTYHGKPPQRLSVCSYTSENLALRPTSAASGGKERAPMNRETKRLLKQRSQESFKDNNKSVTSIPFIDATPPASMASNGLGMGSKLSSSYSPSHKGPAASTPNLPTSTPVHQPAAVQPSVVASEETTSISSSSNLLNGSSNQLSRAEEKIQGRGMSRSNASYGIQQLLQEQISKEEKENQAKIIEREVKAAVAKVSASYEERLSSARAEHNLKIQQVLRDKTTAVNNARNTFESELKRQLSTFEKDLHEIKSKHNSELIHLEQSFSDKMKRREENHHEIIAQYESRDEAWQAEKEEVLAEIKRLKDEANRFIAILSQEDDPDRCDEMLSPGKRQSLTREVESLQLVVEMRTAELHKLREERTRHLQQLDELERTKAMLEKANSRVEDLTVQLAAKTELERQLSWEKTQLESFFQTESKNKTRISMQVEELQWRIKHNKELPPPQVFSPTTMSAAVVASSAEEDSFLASSQQKKELTNIAWHSTPTIVMNNGTKLEDLNQNEEVQQVQQVLRAQRPTSIEGIHPRQLIPPQELNQNSHATSRDSLENINNNNNSHSCNEEEEDLEEEKRDTSKIDSDDAGLSDEGLGDFNSEASNSPQPPSLLSGLKSADFAQQQNAVVAPAVEGLCDKTSSVEDALEAKNNNASLPTSPCDERVPSRIAFPPKRRMMQKTTSNC